MADLFDEGILRQKVEASLEVKNHLLAKVYNRRAIDVESVVEELLSFVERLQPMVADTSLLLNKALDDDKTVLFEGAQATMLDVDHGTYPFVTSSSPIAGGVCTGAGVGPTRIDRVIGVIKAYTTRVGAGPFPTELFDEYGEHLSRVGHEFGSVTGRRRRCAESGSLSPGRGGLGPHFDAVAALGGSRGVRLRWLKTPTRGDTPDGRRTTAAARLPA